MDVVIDALIIEEDRPKHISKHKITVEEVYEVLSGDYVSAKGKLDRIRIIGMTNKQRMVTVVIGVRDKKNTYGLVTARSAKKKEIALYLEISKKED